MDADSTVGILIISRFRVTSLGCVALSVSAVSVTVVPGSPRNFPTDSVRFRLAVGSPSISRILSPAFMPALDAGVPSIGEITVSAPSLKPTTMPSPPNLPVVPILNSSNSFGGSIIECGSNCVSMPLIAVYSISLAVRFSLVWRLVLMKARAS